MHYTASLCATTATAFRGGNSATEPPITRQWLLSNLFTLVCTLTVIKRLLPSLITRSAYVCVCMCALDSQNKSSPHSFDSSQDCGCDNAHLQNCSEEPAAHINVLVPLRIVIRWSSFRIFFPTFDSSSPAAARRKVNALGVDDCVDGDDAPCLVKKTTPVRKPKFFGGQRKWIGVKLVAAAAATEQEECGRVSKISAKIASFCNLLLFPCLTGVCRNGPSGFPMGDNNAISPSCIGGRWLSGAVAEAMAIDQKRNVRCFRMGIGWSACVCVRFVLFTRNPWH